jgi:toxin ParE1/3/4
MKYEVFLIEDAELDLFDIYQYIFVNDSLGKALYVYDKIKEIINKLDQNPQRGHKPKELDRLGITDYLEVYFKPYRVIYQIIGRRVFVHCILDGRRDVEDLLQKRLMR